MTSPDDPSESAEVTSTKARGLETEVKWVPNRNVFVSAYALWQKSEYIVDAAATIGLDARALDSWTCSIPLPASCSIRPRRFSRR